MSGEDEPAIGGFERVMGPNGESQYFATDLANAYRILYEHYRYTYVVPGESGPRTFRSGDPPTRPIGDDVDLAALCDRLEGYSGADIRSIADRAASIRASSACNIASGSISSIASGFVSSMASGFSSSMASAGASQRASRCASNAKSRSL